MITQYVEQNKRIIFEIDVQFMLQFMFKFMILETLVQCWQITSDAFV